MDESKQTLKEEAEKTTADVEEEEEEEEEEDDEEEELDEVDDDEDDDDGGGCEFRVEQRKQLLGESPKTEARVKSETLAVASVSENDFRSYFAASSHLLSEVPVDYALLRPLESPNFKIAVSVIVTHAYM